MFKLTNSYTKNQLKINKRKMNIAYILFNLLSTFCMEGKLMYTPQHTINFNSGNFPLVSENTQYSNGIIINERMLTLEKDRYLDDHRFNNVPFLPGVIGLELFAELSKIVLPEKKILEFVDVRFSSAITLKNDKSRKILTKIKFNIDKDDADASIESTRLKKDEKETKLHFQAKIIFGQKDKENQNLPILKTIPLLNKQFIYQLLPHGPFFQVLSELNQINNEVIAICSNFKREKQYGKNFKEFLIKPLAIEAGFQAIGLMDFILNGRAGLPSKIGKIIFYDSKDKPYFVKGWKKEQNNNCNLFDFIIMTKKGEVVLKIIDYQTVEINLGDTSSAIEKIRSHRIRQLFKMPKMAWLEVINRQLLKEKVSNNPDFLKTFLNEEEMLLIDNTDERKREHLIAQYFAMKRALRVVLFSRNMQNLTIRRDEIDEPFFLKKRKKIFLTLTEAEDYVLAIASYRKKIGISLEESTKNFEISLDELITNEEKEMLEEKKIDLNNQLLLKIFSAKKAAIKTIGENLELNLKKVIIKNFQQEKIILHIDHSYISEKNLKLVNVKKLISEKIASIGFNEEYIGVVCK
ncbi:MAG: 4'-phosphopantetheinyl transferase superfamily protein [Candidatus Heimdallarchaeota archaeon]|nr:4'-phosphopantetheinyl transferase superfamily protein [Candidatus Heimdallarchaeota archaeon]